MILPKQVAMRKQQYNELKETVIREMFYGLPVKQMWEELQEHIHITEDEEWDETEE